MKRIAFCIIALCVIAGVSREAEATSNFEQYWSKWRGPLATGVAPMASPPIEWDENRNVRWKVEIPGKGLSSPIVWGETVFVTSAVETEKRGQPKREVPRRRRRGPPGITTTSIHKFVIFAISRRDGSILWQRTVREELPHEGTHPSGSWASNSPVTDGEHIYFGFGSRGLYCFDMQGNKKWETDLGDMTIRLGFGEGSSPVMYGEFIVVNWDHEGQSFIVALDKKTGREAWRVNREERTSWSTPLVVAHGGKSQVITSATHRTRSYDLATGNLIWECSGMTLNAIPTPVAAGGVVYVTSGFRGNALQAIRLEGAKGNITDTDAIVWELDRDTPYVPSPLLYGDRLYLLKRNDGILSCFNAGTGEVHYGPRRLPGIMEAYASPVGADGRIYIVGRNGTTLVVKDGPMFEVLSQNLLDDGFDASPAVVGKELYLRGRKHLYCIAAN